VSAVPQASRPAADASASRGNRELFDRSSGWSLLSRLAWIATVAVIASLLFGGLAMYWAASIEDNQMHESRLEQLGATLQTIVEERVSDFAPGGADSIPHLKTRPTASLLYRYQVWSRHGSLLLRSHEAPADRPLTGLSHFGFSKARIDDEDYRVFCLPTRDGEFVIQVGENVGEVWSELGITTVYYAGILLIPFGLVLGATWVLLRRALVSINTIADRLRSRNPLEVTPIPVAAPPREVVPILNAMDMLFGRMQRALSIERTFTSLAAHEMRTPLAGLRAQAQLLTRAGLPKEPLETVTTLIRGVDRASYMLDQLLDLARVESLALSGELQMERVLLANVYQEVVNDLAPRILRKQISVSASFRAERLWCHGFALSVLLRNLLANAILYTPVGGRVEVLSMVQDGDVLLAVDDSGQGIAPADRERAFERFNRLGRTQADGVGLGLSIVLSVVEMHRAKIQLVDSPLGGLRAQVLFPQPAGPAQARAPDPLG
jgi:signal transduction histidine kinase